MVAKKEVRKVLNKKITQLNDIIADIDSLLTKMETDFYRVSIFGSARLKPETQMYRMVYDLAFQLALRGVDIVTGGGPGLMDAANKGAKEGGVHSRSIGLPITLPYEESANTHLDVKSQHRRFSSRLDEFMRISHAVVITPGGIGTVLEMFYTWQLIQVNHIEPRPILLLGGENMWHDLVSWLRKWPVKFNLMSEVDMEHIVICKSIEDVVSKLEPEMEAFRMRAKANTDLL